jgi:hypothetical protein
MTTPDLPVEVPAEDWAEQHTSSGTDGDAPLQVGEVSSRIGSTEADEADIVEQETEVPLGE